MSDGDPDGFGEALALGDFDVMQLCVLDEDGKGAGNLNQGGSPASGRLGHEGVVVAVARGDGGPTDLERDFGEESRKRLRFKQQSPELLSHARSVRSAKVAKAKAALLTSEVSARSRALDTVVRSIPLAGKLVGKPQRSMAVGRMKKNLKASDMKVLCRGAHLPSKSGAALGVKQKRLICAGSRLVLLRQKLGLRHILARGREIMRDTPGKPRANFLHVSYSHLWDEVNSKFRAMRSNRFKIGRMSIDMHIIVQRGSFYLAMANLSGAQSSEFHEHWVCQPKQVVGTSAEAVLPAVMEATPEPLRLDRPASLAMTQCSATSVTICFVGDAASSNILLMKRLGHIWETSLPLGEPPAVLVMMDTCGIHMHHRAKLQVLPLRRHTARHFSIAHLYRLHSVQDQMLRLLGLLVVRKVQRRIGAPPSELRGSLKTFVDIVFNPQAGFHGRADGAGLSHQMHDLQALCEMVNGDLCSAEWIHWCWDSTTKRPCCKDHDEAAEKTLVVVVNSLLGKADPIPAESRWTHTLSNFKKTLLRRAVHRIGLDCFHLDAVVAGSKAGQGEDEEIVTGGAEQRLKSTRISRTMDYYRDDRNLHELAILTMPLEVVDSTLLYPLLGDVAPKDGETSKVERLLHPTMSLIGSCAEQLANLLEGWRGLAQRAPWSILDVLHAPLEQQAFQAFARAQILRLASSIARRYEIRFSTWPYTLWGLSSGDTSEVEKMSIAERLLGATRAELDIYSFGLRQRYNTVQLLLSEECRRTVQADFRNHPYGTDTIERLNAEVTALHPRRAPGRQFANAARESVLSQTSAIHCSSGGDHPLKPPKLCAATGKQEQVRACALLPPLAAFADGAPGGPISIDDDPAPMASRAPQGEAASSSDPPPTAHALGSIDLSVASNDTAWFGQALTVTRENPALLLSEPGQVEKEASQRRGLSPFLLQRNQYMKSFKAAKGRVLTAEEVAQGHASFNEIWQSIPDKKGFRAQYEDWRTTPRPSGETTQPIYKTLWGGGCRQTPITADEFFSFVSSSGWPTDAELLDSSNTEGKVGPMPAQPFAQSAGYRLWGCGRAPRNVDKATVASARRFDIVEKGLVNYITEVGRDVADSGQLMLMVEGTPLPTATSRSKRCVIIVSGTTYKPKVFDCAQCEFKLDDNEVCEQLRLPCEVVIKRRPCRVASQFAAIAFQTSDEFVLDLTTAFSTMHLFKLEYDIVVGEDNSLRCSKVNGASLVGALWKAGMERPLQCDGRPGGAKKARLSMAALDQLMIADPLAVTGRHNQAAFTGRAKPAADAQAGARSGSRAGPTASSCGATGPVVGGQGLPTAERSTSDFQAGSLQGLNEENAVACNLLEEGLDLADELELLMDDSDLEEFDATYNNADGRTVDEPPLVSAKAQSNTDADHDPATLAELAKEVAEIVERGEAAEGSADTPATAPAGSTDDAPPQGVEPPLPQRPWEQVGEVTPSGYVYDGLRSVLRIQRGKPAGSVTVNCYRHPGCRMLLSMARCPDDLTLKQWLFEVDAPLPGATADERKALAKQHMDLGRGRWFVGRRAA